MPISWFILLRLFICDCTTVLRFGMWIIAISFFLALMLTVLNSTVVFDLIPNLIPEYAYYTKMLYGGLSTLGLTIAVFFIIESIFYRWNSDNISDNQNAYSMIKLIPNTLKSSVSTVCLTVSAPSPLFETWLRSWSPFG